VPLIEVHHDDRPLGTLIYELRQLRRHTADNKC
jgi:hypothetical protein